MTFIDRHTAQVFALALAVIFTSILILNAISR
jgi:hypothetical protein